MAKPKKAKPEAPMALKSEEGKTPKEPKLKPWVSDDPRIRQTQQKISERTIAQRRPHVRFKETDEHPIVTVVDDKGCYMNELSSCTGVSDPIGACELLQQVVKTIPGKTADTARSASALMAEIEPQNALEGLIVAQMMGCHNLAMEMMGRAVIAGATVEQVDRNINRATKLTRTFVALTESLHKLRTGGKQVIQVQHQQVNVSDGGQAIVGTVNNRGEG